MHPTAVHAWASRFWRLPVDASAHGPATDAHLLLNLWIALGLAVLLHALLAAALLNRSRSKRAPDKRWVELLPLAAFALLFAFLAIRADALWNAAPYTGRDRAATQIEVVGEQFAWYVRYPGPDATFGRTRPELVSAAEANPLGVDLTDPHAGDDIVRSQLVLPAGRPVDIALRSLDVIHGFSIPELRVKQNANPGSVAHIHITATVPGDYAILCTQVCGSGHFRMAATARVLPAADFDRWLSAQQTAAGQATP